ncbi:MAG: beta-galactosidase, partial [Planctomycetota bacterium]|nr:beta-galactosidase [Planctomycetota bacterium]
MTRQSSVPSDGPIFLGASYYPEHWPEEHWAQDVRLMREAGFTVARVGEFAWSTFEPAAGEFHFDWMDRAIALLADNGIATVMGTPTCSPPAWLTQPCPDMLQTLDSGRQAQHGGRCHYCITSPDLAAATVRIVEAMANRYGENPNVIGWQIDNEFSRVCFCDRCHGLFRQFLQRRYGTLEELNRSWSTAYWSQSYSSWEQIPNPWEPKHNPGLMLEHKRFISDCNRRYQKLQVDILRARVRPGAWISHNFMGWFDGLDHYEMTEDLDLVAWDWYVGAGHNDPLATGVIHDLTRGFKRRNFWIMETQPGSVNWSGLNNVLYKGEARAMAWEAIGHGANAILYWQWRSALGGQEQFHGTLVDQSGRPRPFYHEVQKLGEDLQAASPVLAGSRVVAETAMLNDYPSRWAIQYQLHNRNFNYVAHFTHYYRPLAEANVPVDVLSADEGLEGYKLVIAPALQILNARRAGNLKRFVERGGHLVLTLRTGMKDETNALLPSRQPGPLAELAGVEVLEYYSLDEPAPVVGDAFTGTAVTWAEMLGVLDEANTRVLARYGPSNGWLDGQPAVTVHRYGKGTVTFVGAYLDEASQKALMNAAAAAAGVGPVMPTPPGVTACRRVSPSGREIVILGNHTRSLQRVPLPWAAREHLAGRDC